MGLGARGGRSVRVALFATWLVSACGGRSIAVGDDEGAAGEGASGASGTGNGGTIGVGGSISNGGSTGGIAGSIPMGGVAGTIPTGGVAGTIGVGGSNPCPDCPSGMYYLRVQGDGSPYALWYNGWAGVAAACPGIPLRGTLVGCGGGGVYVSACFADQSGTPCLAISGTIATYIDSVGDFWRGDMTSNVLTVATSPELVSGTLGVELSNESGEMLVLTVDYTFCTAGVRLAGICR